LLKNSDNISHTWCPEIYRTVFIDRFNDDKIYVAPCCQAKGEYEAVNTFDFNNSPYLSNLREQFNNGEKAEACNRCWKSEERGLKSRRQSAIEFFNLEEPDTTVRLESIDHSATWACNLACIMCNPQSSSLWATQKNLSKAQLVSMGRYFQRSNNFLDRLDLTHIKKIHFNGGEPMLNNDQVDLLLKLDEQNVLKDTFISYNTNGTVMPNKKIIDLWNRAKLVKLFFSIDAIGSAFEYIRWPANWNQTSSNMLEMKNNLPDNVMFGFNVTVGSYNLLELPSVYKWFEENLKSNRACDPSDFCVQFANNFDPTYLPQEVKKIVIEQLLAFPELSGIVNYIESTLNCTEDLAWTEQLTQLDASRNTDWKKALAVSQYIKDTTC
jgi:MoaA/NifB/PqqE/SkfB family radical SAM enzyme